MIALHQKMASASLGGVDVDASDSNVGVSETTPINERGAFFTAQVLLAVAAIPFFARILSLSQIDSTLGPMTQIIWTMLSHLGKFVVFTAVLMASFALTFHVIFHSCEDGTPLDEAYGTFSKAYLTMFRAMLGEFHFDILETTDACQHPSWGENVGAPLLVSYLAIMSILLLNLLIAVLSTAHAEVRDGSFAIAIVAYTKEPP